MGSDKNTISIIVRILGKLLFLTLDTFLFNDARSGQPDLQCLDALEHIKDGRPTDSKYSCKILRFRTPNVVVIFSIVDHDFDQLSKD